MYDYQSWRAHDAGRRALHIASDCAAGLAMIAALHTPLRPLPVAPATAPDWRAERAEAWQATHAKAAEADKAAVARPFRFEDLNGKPEPESWGPVYPKSASAAVEKWRRLERGRELTAAEAREYGAAVHAWIRGLNKSDGAPRAEVSLKSTEFNAARHRAKLIAAFHATAAADRRSWALGQAKDANGRTIVDLYEAAMAAKRARLGLAEAA
jgi:hypothetical protein